MLLARVCVSLNDKRLGVKCVCPGAAVGSTSSSGSSKLLMFVDEIDNDC